MATSSGLQSDRSGLSVVSIALFRRYQRRKPATTDQPALHRHGEQYIGRTFTLEQPVVNGVGKPAGR